MLRSVSGALNLWLAVVLFAASNSIVKTLINLGAQNTIDGRNPITFCNVLCAGNLCAGIALYIIYRKQWTLANLRKLSVADWVSLLVLALLTNTFTPWLYFMALDITTVTNVVIVSQIEPPLVLALGWLLLSERLGLLAAIGAALCVVGISLSVMLQPGEGAFMIGKGELFVALAAVSNAVSTILAKQRLTRIPLGIFTVFRNIVGTVVFFVIACYYYGPIHFVDLAAPYLWKWMLLYGCIIIVGGQVLWFSGLKASRTIDILLASSATPIAGVLFAFLILGEVPLRAQYIGGFVLVCGIVIGLLANRRRAAMDKRFLSEKVDDAPAAVDAEKATGFKGI
jgi:drug/metabolite transporter (DMT)-like permease